MPRMWSELRYEICIIITGGITMKENKITKMAEIVKDL